MQDKKNNEIHEWLTLALTPKVGPVTMLKLIQHFGSVTNVLSQSQNTLAQVVNRTVAKLISEKTAEPDVEKSFAWADSHANHYIISLEDERYPKELAQLTDPPLILYLKGNIDLLKKNKLAIVGTRHPSTQGMQNATDFARDLAKNGLTIVSGMALGIDKCAHSGALDGAGSTIGVIGTGIDQVYPSSNRALFEAVTARGGLIISEFPLATPPLVSNFPRRNRIIAGLAKGCLVIESAIDGGSMITANLALEMGREVMAIPGSIHNPVSRGCHKLIKTGAKLIETSNDILEELYLDRESTIRNNASATTNPVLVAMGFDPIEIDRICANLNLSFADICPKLLELELDGEIVNCGSGKYQRIFK